MAGNKRESFLMRMYGEYWDNITRAEDSAWKIFASYTTLFAGLSLAYAIISDLGFLLLLLIFSFVAITMALRANLWFVRNLGLISNIEQEFLEKKDYGTIVPCWFLKKIGFINDEIWWIHIIAYLTVALSVTSFMYHKLEAVARQYVLIVLIIGLLLCFVYGFSLYIQHIEFKSQAPGKYISEAETKS
jgi:hypothetical protein